MKRTLSRLKAAFLVTAVVAGITVGLSQNCKAQSYNVFYTYDYVELLQEYQRTGNVAYYYEALANYYYYLAGLNADYYGYYGDPVAYKSA